jgi:hypothetical protein
MLIHHPKPTLEAFIQTCTPLAKIEALEQQMKQRIGAIAVALRSYEPANNPVDNLKQFLQADKNFLGVLLALTNLSQEKFLRILSADRFARNDFAPEWSINAIYGKLKNEPEFAEQIAHLFLEGRTSPLLIEQVASFYLDQLSLPDNWNELIRDQNLIENIIRRKLSGEYIDKKGDEIEKLIRSRLDAIQQRYGMTHTKGQSPLVGKEIDHAIPATDDPFVLIMTSYMETTSSTQTTRANEQSELYGIIQRDNRRYGHRRIFINFIDGAGWLARRSDLRKMYDGCDYILNLRTLDHLEGIVCRHVPERYFTHSPKPEVKDAP